MDTATTEIYTLSLHDALPICKRVPAGPVESIHPCTRCQPDPALPILQSGSDEIRTQRSEEHTSELQSLTNLVCRLLLEKKKQKGRSTRRSRRRADRWPNTGSP